jgi:apolipoprotein N-acyltransferase
MLAGVLASALLLGVYARGGSGWMLAPMLLVPWLRALDAQPNLRASLLCAWLMSVAFVGACFHWFAAALDAYTDIGHVGALLVLLALAPLLQPQLLVYALVRHAVHQRRGRAAAAVAAGLAWVGCEWLLPKLFGDTLGHGLAGSTLLRQAADLGGAAGLSLLILWINEGLAAALVRAPAPRQRWLPIGAAALILLLFGYGTWRLHSLQENLSTPAPALRVGMVQSGIVDYERLREEIGTYGVMRRVLDTHYAMSQAAIEQQGAQALLWSETVYPTPFGHPRSADGAELDRELLGFVDAMGVPLLFGTYDLDADGEYNAAALVEPGVGLVGYYRKTHPFPFTEHVPPLLDQPWLRRLLPWAGSWQRGQGPRVLPLRPEGGPEVNVLPMICLDSVSPELAIEGARLGAQAILGLSNDSWFTDSPQGARLHLAVATFRSIETRMPQLRLTSNGMTAIIDETGEVLVATSMGDQALLVGDIPARDPVPTLMVRWGDWVGPSALLLLVLAAAWSLAAALRRRYASPSMQGARKDAAVTAFSDGTGFDVILLPAGWRAVAAALRLLAGLGLLGVLLQMLLVTGLQVNSLRQILLFGAGVVAPALAAWAILRAHRLQARIDAGRLQLARGQWRRDLTLSEVQTMQTWRLPLPWPGLDLELSDGSRHSLALRDPVGLRQALLDAGVSTASDGLQPARVRWQQARAAAHRRWLDHPLTKFVLFPLLPALPAFRLHQYIAFGGSFGEYHSYGLGPYLGALLIWWASWAIGLCLFAGVLRVVIEAIAAAGLLLQPRSHSGLRTLLEWTGRALYYLGVPAWLGLRLLSG